MVDKASVADQVHDQGWAFAGLPSRAIQQYGRGAMRLRRQLDCDSQDFVQHVAWMCMTHGRSQHGRYTFPHDLAQRLQLCWNSYFLTAVFSKVFQ